MMLSTLVSEYSYMFVYYMTEECRLIRKRDV